MRRLAWPWDPRRGCPPDWALGRAASQGLTDELSAHVVGCDRCAGELRALEQLGRRAQELKATAIPRSSRERIVMALRSETVLPRRPPTTFTRTGLWLGVAAAAVVLGTGTLLASLYRRPPDVQTQVVGRSGEAPASGTPVASPGAGDQGTVARPGTAVASDVGSPPDREQPPAVTPAAARLPRQTHHRTVALKDGATLAPPPAPRTVEPPAWAMRAAFEQGWQLLRGGRLLEAATAFAALERSAAGDPIVEDALFWRGVALSRAGQKLEARLVMSTFVSRFPDSPRAGEASTMLGWMMVEAGDRAGAVFPFERGARDRSERVRTSARNGLMEIEALDGPPPPQPRAAQWGTSR